MELELLSFGLIAGFIGGFLGVGGGMVLIPMLLLVGFDMKSSISISIMQMVFTSIFGTYLNFRKNNDFIKSGIFIGIGGFAGGLISGLIVTNVSNEFLQYLFILIILLAIYKISTANTNANNTSKTKENLFILLLIGLSIGMIAMSIGVGGSVMLTPILVSYMYYSLKDASSLGLFFVVFSSIAGFISLAYNHQMLYYEGLIVATASLLGVFLGIQIKQIVSINSYKTFLLLLYSLILISVIFKTV